VTLRARGIPSIVAIALALAVGACGDPKASRGVQAAATQSEIHVRLDGSGSLEARAELPLGRWTLDGGDEAAAKALSGLKEALAREVATTRRRHGTGHTFALMLEAAPNTPWAHVAWMLAIAANPRVKIRPISFVETGGRKRIDVLLPEDRGMRSPMATKEGRMLSLAFTREGTSEGASVTRVLATTRTVYLTEDAELLSHEELKTEARSARERGAEVPPVVLTDGVESARTEAWTTLRGRLGAGVEPGDLLYGEVVASSHSGGSTPFHDVFEGMALLRSMGAGALSFPDLARATARAKPQ
jgi:hypothetical protein